MDEKAKEVVVSDAPPPTAYFIPHALNHAAHFGNNLKGSGQMKDVAAEPRCSEEREDILDARNERRYVHFGRYSVPGLL